MWKQQIHMRALWQLRWQTGWCTCLTNETWRRQWRGEDLSISHILGRAKTGKEWSNITQGWLSYTCDCFLKLEHDSKLGLNLTFSNTMTQIKQKSRKTATKIPIPKYSLRLIWNNTNKLNNLYENMFHVQSMSKCPISKCPNENQERKEMIF